MADQRKQQLDPTIVLQPESSFLPLRHCRKTSRRVSRTEESSSDLFPGLSKDVLHMRVKEGSKIRNLLRVATAQMAENGKGQTGPSVRQVLFTGSERGVTKTVTCVEILKRRVGGLHQVSKVSYKKVSEVWESFRRGKQKRTLQKTVPAVWILLSKDPLDPHELGYQPPPTTAAVEVERCDDESPSQETEAKGLCMDVERLFP